MVHTANAKHTVKLVSGPVPASSLPTGALDSLTVLFHGEVAEFRRRFTRETFPRVTGLGHVVDDRPETGATALHLTLLEKIGDGWVAARSDPR